ncbi:hypothetical protein [Dyella sp. ASV21]|uniref:hypothetical protein n=1 Tax=Dyella sp. ASV21 TaxID=2795114 RepID=UPI0018EC6745|nr:hypothetical protein [Dyella sp. ASV21]
MAGTLASLLALSAHASPCTGVDRTLSDARRAALAPAIAHQLTLPFVDVLQSFRLKGWSIVYVDTHVSDERFLFYSADPLTGHAVTEWGGAATRDEGDDIQRWLLKNAPSIPPALARCFAWHVTQDRDQ